MSENIKIFVGLLVPAATILAYVFSVFSENYILGIFLPIFGISSWLIFSVLVKSYWPQITGNIIIVFGALLALSVFLDAGLEQNMFGGLNFHPGGIASSTILFFFSILIGVLFKNTDPNFSSTKTQKNSRKTETIPANNDNNLEKNEKNSIMPEHSIENDPDYLNYSDEYFPGYQEYFQEDYEE